MIISGRTLYLSVWDNDNSTDSIYQVLKSGAVSFVYYLGVQEQYHFKHSEQFSLKDLIEISNSQGIHWKIFLSENMSKIHFRNIRNKEFKIFPEYFLLDTFYSYELKRKTGRKLDLLYCSLNRYPKSHRVKFVDEAYKASIMGESYTTWNILTNEYEYTDYSKEHVGEFKHWSETRLGEETEVFGVDGIKSKSFNPYTRPSDRVFDCLFEIVGESGETGEFFTEKTFKPILDRRPFIINGGRFQNVTLAKRFGFKLYDDIIDYSFDSKRTYEQRCIHLVDALLQIRNVDYNKLYKKIQSKVEFNFLRALEIVNEFKKDSKGLDEIRYFTRIFGEKEKSYYINHKEFF